MADLQLLFPYAQIGYTAIIVPEELDFHADDAESAFHWLLTDKLVLGEFYAVSQNAKDNLRDRLVALGCRYYEGKNTFPSLHTDPIQHADREGYVYYARQNWSEEDIAVFTNVGTGN